MASSKVIARNSRNVAKGPLLALLLIASCAGVADPENRSKDLLAPNAADAAMTVVEDMSIADAAVSVHPDMGATADLSRIYVEKTIHAIDTGGAADGAYVLIRDVVVTTPIAVRQSGSNCTYKVWVQDFRDTQANLFPAGLDLFILAPSSSAGCPAGPAPLAGHTPGDTVTVRGKLYVSSTAQDGGVGLTEHSVYPDFLDTTGPTVAVTPVLLNDPQLFTYYGAGFQAYEGMLISLGCTAPACSATSNKLVVKSQPNPYLWATSPAGVFGIAFGTQWPGKPGANGTAYTRIVGVANTFLTGSLEPRSPSDFVP